MAIVKKVLRWLGVLAAPVEQPDGQSCFNCAAFSYCDPDDVDECDGYCCHHDHFDKRKSPHYEYGGHWTSHGSWCDWWMEADADEVVRRAALLKSHHTVTCGRCGHSWWIY